MTQLDKIIELKNLEKQNRKNRLEDKLRQKEYYGEVEELFDPLTKTTNANNEYNLEQNLVLGEETLRAIDWQNQKLDKQTKMIEQTRNKKSMEPDLSHETIKETQNIAPVYVDTKTAKILHDLGAETNPQLKLDLVDLHTRRHKIKSVNITQEQGKIIAKDNIYENSDGFINFLTNPR